MTPQGLRASDEGAGVSNGVGTNRSHSARLGGGAALSGGGVGSMPIRSSTSAIRCVRPSRMASRISR
jgi:hypothetical protein